MKSPDAPISPLEALRYVLQESGYDTDLILADEDPGHPYEELLVSYRGDDEPPPLAVRLLLSSELARGLPAELVPQQPGSDLLQLLVNLPLQPEPAQFGDLDQLLNRINLKLPQGRFVLPEKEGLLFQDAIPLLPEQLLPGLVAEAVEMSGFLAGRYYSAFAQLVLEQAPLDTIFAGLGG